MNSTIYNLVDFIDLLIAGLCLLKGSGTCLIVYSKWNCYWCKSLIILNSKEYILKTIKLFQQMLRAVKYFSFKLVIPS